MENKLGVFTVLILVASLISVPLTFGHAFAKHDDPGDEPLPTYEGYEPLRFYVIYASYYRDCIKFDQKKIEFFKHVSNQYLRMIGFLPISSNPFECVKVTGTYEITSGDPTQGLTLDDAIQVFNLEF